MAGHNKKKYPLDRILQRADERTSKAVQITPTLAAEYLEHIEEIMRLEKDLVARRAINYGEVLKILENIEKTDELRNCEEFKELKNNLTEAHKYWGYLRGTKKQ